MLTNRAIPCLLLSDGGLVKTVGFKPGKYVGDPTNALKIFNEKEVDEIVFLDIDASRQGRGPDFALVEEIVSECFMPICYGGGVRNLETARRLVRAGVEKIALNSVLFDRPEVLSEISNEMGASSAVAVVNVLRGKVYDCARGRLVEETPVEFARRMEALGAGEIFLSDVARDGAMQGYDFSLIEQVSAAVGIPVIACGGAGSVSDLRAAIDHGASAAAAGSMFVFIGRLNAVLITYPEREALTDLFRETAR